MSVVRSLNTGGRSGNQPKRTALKHNPYPAGGDTGSARSAACIGASSSGRRLRRRARECTGPRQATRCLERRDDQKRQGDGTGRIAAGCQQNGKRCDLGAEEGCHCGERGLAGQVALRTQHAGLSRLDDSQHAAFGAEGPYLPQTSQGVKRGDTEFADGRVSPAPVLPEARAISHGNTNAEAANAMPIPAARPVA